MVFPGSFAGGKDHETVPRYRNLATPGRLVAIAILVASVAVSLFVSRRTTPQAPELEGLRAAARCASVVRNVAEHGIGELASARARLSYERFQGQGTTPALLGAWSSLSIGRVGLLDLSTSSRLPWLVLAALTPWLIYCWLRPLRGVMVATFAALSLLSWPGWSHASVMAGSAASVAACHWLVLVAYARSLPTRRARPRALCWALGAAVALGFGAAWSLASLWVVPVVALHFCVTRWHELGRLLSRGRWPLPVFLAMALVVSPLTVLALNPALWGESSGGLAYWLLAPSTAARASVGAGASAGAAPLLAAALMGLAVIVHRGLARKFAAGTRRPTRDPHAVGALVLTGLGLTLVAPLGDAGPLRMTFAAAAAGIGFGWAVGVVRKKWQRGGAVQD